MVTERNQTLGGEHVIEYADTELQCCTPEIYIVINQCCLNKFSLKICAGYTLKLGACFDLKSRHCDPDNISLAHHWDSAPIAVQRDFRYYHQQSLSIGQSCAKTMTQVISFDLVRTCCGRDRYPTLQMKPLRPKRGGLLPITQVICDGAGFEPKAIGAGSTRTLHVR